MVLYECWREFHNMFDFLKNRQSTKNDLFDFMKNKQNSGNNEFSFNKAASSEETPYEKKEKYIDKVYEHERWERYYDAVKTLKEALTFFPNDLEIISLTCESLFETEGYKEIIELANNGLQIAQQQANQYYISVFERHLASAFLESNELEKAEKYFLWAIGNMPEYSYNYYTLGLCYFRQKKYDKAIQSFKKYVITESSSAVSKDGKKMIKKAYWEKSQTLEEYSHIDKGIKFEEEGKSELALKEYSEACKINPKLAEGFCRISLLKSNCNETREAILFGLRAMAVKMENEDYENSNLYSILFKELSENYSKSSDEQNSKKCKILSRYYGAIAEGDLIAESGYDVIKRNNIYEEYKTAISFYSEDYEAYDKIIFLCLNFKNYKRTLVYLKDALFIAQKRRDLERISRYFHTAGTCFWHLGEHERAIVFNEKALETTSDLNLKFVINYDLSCLFEVENRLEESLEKLERCQEYVKDGADESLDLQSRLMKIKALLCENSPINRARELYAEGISWLNEEQTETAIKCFQQSLEYIPLDVKVMLRLSQSLESLGRRREALDVSKEGFKVCRLTNNLTFIDKFAYQASCCLATEKKDFEKALYYAKAAAEYQPKNEEYHFWIGQCYFYLKDFMNALDGYKRAYYMNKNPETLELIHKCESLLDE